MEQIVTVVLIAGMFWALVTLYRAHSHPRCLECNSHQLGVISKEPLGMRGVTYHGGSDGGGSTSVQVGYQVTTRCNACRAQWTTTMTETN